MPIASRRLAIMARACALAAATFFVTSCIPQPDGRSGGDGYRNDAAPIVLDEPTVDSVSWPDGDRTDWRRFVMEQSGVVTVVVQFSNLSVAASVELFDTYGASLTRRIKESGRDARLEISEPLAPGRYFLRIQAADEGDASDYTVVISTGQG